MFWLCCLSRSIQTILHAIYQWLWHHVIMIDVKFCTVCQGVGIISMRHLVGNSQNLFLISSSISNWWAVNVFNSFLTSYFSDYMFDWVLPPWLPNWQILIWSTHRVTPLVVKNGKQRIFCKWQSERTVTLTHQVIVPSQTTTNLLTSVSVLY